MIPADPFYTEQHLHTCAGYNAKVHNVTNENTAIGWFKAIPTARLTKPTEGAIKAALALAEPSVTQYYHEMHAQGSTAEREWHRNAREEIERMANVIDANVRASELITRAHSPFPHVTLSFNSWLPDKQFLATETVFVNEPLCAPAVSPGPAPVPLYSPPITRQRDAFGDEPESAIAACQRAKWREISGV
jgi:hypothetical protein